MSDLKEYVVTAANYEILDELVDEITKPGGNSYIPSREVEIANLRPVSRNTHFYLTDEEAELLKQDPRVISVSRTLADLGLFPTPSYIQTESSWFRTNKSVIASNHKNWGLLRCFEGAQRLNWGSNGTTNQTGTINVMPTGKNVDLVIVDGLFDPAHPEFARNPDGTGGSRVIQYNWYALNPEVTGGPARNYVYTPYGGDPTTQQVNNNNHGAHVAGTAAGNTQGWARDANIYNIYAYALNPSIDLIFDYIRVFHKNKPINPTTGYKNPTITNNSWGYERSSNISNITNITFRGTAYSGPFSVPQLLNFGIIVDINDVAYFPSREPGSVDGLLADMQDAIAEGIIIVSAAGNTYAKVDVPGGIDYNNTVTYSGYTQFYHRGMTPSAENNVICVGSVDTFYQEYKAQYSNSGPRIDVYAPGSGIISSIVVPGGSYLYNATDPRNPNYWLSKIDGTSMASPQVAGMLACVLEMYPNMTQAEALQYIKSYSKVGQLSSTNGGLSDRTNLQGSPNRFLTYYKERPDVGNVYPKNNYKGRPESGVVYPRRRVLRYGS